MKTRPPSRSARGFTLVELMIVVCIIGIIASIAIPNFVMMTQKARVAERSVTLRALAHSIKDLVNEKSINNDAFVLVAGFNPPLVGGKPSPLKKPFQAVAGWDKVSYEQSSSVWHHYAITGGVSGSTTFFVITAQGDVDGDGLTNQAVSAWTLQGDVWGEQFDDTAPLGDGSLNDDF